MSARGHPRRRQHCVFGPHRTARRDRDTHDRAVHRVETAQHSLKRTPRFHLAPREAQNDARPEYRAILYGECALGAVEGRFGFAVSASVVASAVGRQSTDTPLFSLEANSSRNNSSGL